MQELFNAYHQRYRCMPPEHAEPTRDQLSAFSFLIESNQTPYADFAVWGPHGHRLVKRMKMQGMIMDSSGEFKTIELMGPPDFRNWKESYQLLKTVLVMFDVINMGSIEQYEDLIEKYTLRYPDTWHVIYQADVRARMELLERHRRRGRTEHAIATQSGVGHAYDPVRPWNFSWEAMLVDDRWWKRELEDPCILLLTRVAQRSSLLGGDALTAPDGGTGSSSILNHFGGGGGGRQRSGVAKRQGDEAGECEGGTSRKRPQGRVHNVRDGAYTTNRSGRTICPDFDSGTCPVKSPFCPKGAHQCSRCLGSHPRVDNGTECHRPAPNVEGRGRGRGGGGRGKGRKGRGRGRS